MHELEFQRIEVSRKRQNRINKTFLLFFLILAIFVFVSRFALGILYDLGYYEGTFYLEWWESFFRKEEGYLPDIENPYWLIIFSRRPNFLWMFTQFTWLTTTILIIYIIFRLFGSTGNVPRWLRWVRSQRTLSIITIYEIIIAVIYWSSFSVVGIGLPEHNERSLYIWNLTVTIFVHAILPFFTFTYSILFLIHDKSASLLREQFVFKAMIWPLIYTLYYLLVANVWDDPYPVTFFKENFLTNFFKLLLGIFVIYFLIGVMIVIHNYILIYFNKEYIPSQDVDALDNKQRIIEKMKQKATKNVLKNEKFRQQIDKLTREIIAMERQIDLKKRSEKRNFKIAKRELKEKQKF